MMKRFKDWAISVEYFPARTSGAGELGPAGVSQPERWCVSAGRTGEEVGAGSRIIGSFGSLAEAEAAAQACCQVWDLGSVCPLDVGFDLRTTGVPVVLPNSALVARVKVPGKHGPRTIEGDDWMVRLALRERGYQVS